MSDLEGCMPLFAGFALLLAVLLGIDHFSKPVGPDPSRAGRKAAILEMRAEVTALLERDDPILKSKFLVTDFQVHDYFDRHPEKFKDRDGRPQSFTAARDAALELARGEHHDQVMKEYIETARQEVDYQEGAAAEAAARKLHIVRSSHSGDNRVLAVAGKRVIDEADFQLFLEVSLDPPQRAQLVQTPGAREFYLKRFLDYEVMAAKARREGLK